MLRQQYRELVEMIVAQNKKLETIQSMKCEAEAQLGKITEGMESNEATLRKYEDRLASLEQQMFGLEA